MNRILPNKFSQQNIIFILRTLLGLTFIGIFYLFFYSSDSKTKISKNNLENSEIYNSAVLIPHYPTKNPGIKDYGFSQYTDDPIEKDSKFISYLKDDVIYLKNIQNNTLSDEVVVSKDLPKIEDYLITTDKRFLIYSYAKGEIIKSKNFDIEGNAHYVDIKNLSSGEVKTIFSYNQEIGKVLSLSSSPVANLVFIGTDNYRLYYYDIENSKLYDISYKDDPPKQKYRDFCVGYKVIDQTPDLNNLLLKELCFEGNVHYLYNPKTQERISGKYAYVSGRYFKKFLDNGSFLAYDTKEEGITFVGKYNFENQLVQELPKTEIENNPLDSINIFSTKDNYDKSEKYFLTSEKEIMLAKGNTEFLINGQKYLGKNLSMIEVF